MQPVDGQKDLYRPVNTILFMGTLFYGNEVALRVMIDIEGPLGYFSISLIGEVHIGARALLDIQYN